MPLHSKHGVNLITALNRASLPTPRASDADKGGRGDLLTVLRGYETRHAGTLATRTASGWRSGKASEETHQKNSRPLPEQLAEMCGNRAGHTNPRFLEWMMGLKTGHTELPPSGNLLFRRSRN
jgi:NAD(P)H-hydrate repair Nnr-like enzyme with NAD(P)H-hydrate dehydratase domain